MKNDTTSCCFSFRNNISCTNENVNVEDEDACIVMSDDSDCDEDCSRNTQGNIDATTRESLGGTHLLSGMGDLF